MAKVADNYRALVLHGHLLCIAAFCSLARFSRCFELQSCGVVCQQPSLRPKKAPHKVPTVFTCRKKFFIYMKTYSKFSPLGFVLEFRTQFCRYAKRQSYKAGLGLSSPSAGSVPSQSLTSDLGNRPLKNTSPFSH